tara:strand:+ start:970 stop:1632 length:663 start_codon:yes stop_codon:yes gene_type:complete
MKQQRKEFIIQAHSAACSEWKQKIETEFPKLFKKDELIVGQWYKSNGFLRRFNGKYGNGSVYGFRKNGSYDQLLGFHREDTHLPATDKEVSEALIAEAVKRGFDRSDIKFKLIEGCVGEVNERGITSAYEIVYQASSNALVLKTAGSLYTIFKNGIWTEIVEEEKPVYEWQYSFIGTQVEGFKVEKAVSSFYYTSKKEFIKRQGHLTPIKKVKGSKRIRK